MNITENKLALAVIGGVVVTAVLGSVVVLLQGTEYASLTSTRGPAERLPLPVIPPSFEIVDAYIERSAFEDLIGVCVRWRSHRPREEASAVVRVSNPRGRELIGKIAQWLPALFDVLLSSTGTRLTDEGSGTAFSSSQVVDPETGQAVHLGPIEYMVDVTATDHDGHTHTRNNLLLTEVSECEPEPSPIPSV